MAAKPLYGKNSQKSSSLKPVDQFPRNLVCSIGDSRHVKFSKKNAGQCATTCFEQAFFVCEERASGARVSAFKHLCQGAAILLFVCVFNGGGWGKGSFWHMNSSYCGCLGVLMWLMA